MDYERILKEIATHVRPLRGQGKVADYIPALAAVPAEKFGMAVRTSDGQCFQVGDAAERFSIQSVSKIFTLSLAMRCVGEHIWRRVGREPSGNPFNSLVQLEYENGLPRNPLINAGAIVVSDILASHFDDPKTAIRDHLRRVSGAPDIDFDADVAASEDETGFINRALANFLKGHGNLTNSVAEVLDLYFHQCALAMSCVELATAAAHFANGGVAPVSGDTVLTPEQTKRINAVMLTCGLYDSVGDFAYRVGLPAKSGVGGGIVAVMPGVFTAAVWAPELDTSGNSLLGGAALEYLTTVTGQSVF